jgi:hypothetical protein
MLWNYYVGGGTAAVTELIMVHGHIFERDVAIQPR